MESQKGPLAVSEKYREAVRETLGARRVSSTGHFDRIGRFSVVRLGEKTDTYNQTYMWAQNLLHADPNHDGVRTTREGFLQVYSGRIAEPREAPKTPLFVIGPGNVRYVNDFNSFGTIVGESGWLLGPHRHWRFQQDEPITHQKMEEILVNAEAGKKPPFFDNFTAFVKVDPLLEGTSVEVVSFSGVEDIVVIDRQRRQLVERVISSDILSVKRWEPEPLEPSSIEMV